MRYRFQRSHMSILLDRLSEVPRQMIVVSGPRQIGKSTMVGDALEQAFSSDYVATDNPLTLGAEDIDFSSSGVSSSSRELFTEGWLVDRWQKARSKAQQVPEGKTHVLAIDEVQKIPKWSEIVKGLWDADRAENLPLHVILLGSSPWQIQKGLTESLAGRYEPIFMTHWSYPEMQEAFDFSLDQYVFFGGYPGGANYVLKENSGESRWRGYIRNSLIDPMVNKDILEMTRVDKPALLRQLFGLGMAYSGRIVAYTKLQGQLQDAGNTTTLSHYLQLLSQASLLTGLHKYAEGEIRKRASIPKLNTHNLALVSALGNYSFLEAKNDRKYWGHLVESTVGAHLLNSASEACRIFYWRESPYEVDFILSKGQKLLAIEVKSGSERVTAYTGISVFLEKFKKAKSLIVGDGGVPLHEFLSCPPDNWLA